MYNFRFGNLRSWSRSLTFRETPTAHEKLCSITMNQWLLNTMAKTKNKLLFILGLQIIQCLVLLPLLPSFTIVNSLVR